MIVGLVTARGGSKRIRGKNSRELGGRPLINWSIAAAQHATLVDTVMVSTDDSELADIARQAGADVPFMRPKVLAGDKASHYDVISHALDWIADQDIALEAMVLLQPTSPFRTAQQIDEAITMWRSSPHDSLVSVCRVTHHPAFMYKHGADGSLAPFCAQRPGYQRSQDQEELYVLNGALYVFSPEPFRGRETVLGTSPTGYVMDLISSHDIDTPYDLEIAQAIVSQRAKQGKTRT